ncbi:MAG: helix-turn-helix domain-containing protein [Acidobacteria bacterium]|nr:helix-turn-helix domain-containing protein [Acidobacteriota bacterium]
MDANRPGGNAGADELPAVLLLDDVAALLRCSTTTIKRRLRARVFPVAPLSGIDKRPRWSKAALLRWLEAGGSGEAVRGRRRGPR